jgi:hypothetical protein
MLILKLAELKAFAFTKLAFRIMVERMNKVKKLDGKMVFEPFFAFLNMDYLGIDYAV